MTPAVEQQLATVVDGIEQRNRDILPALPARRNEPLPSSIDARVMSMMEGKRLSPAKPTQSNVDACNIAASKSSAQLMKLHTLVEVDLAKLEKDMETAGALRTSETVPVSEKKP